MSEANSAGRARRLQAASVLPFCGVSDGSGFDRYASSYDEDLARGLSASGEDRAFFARGRIEWLKRRLDAGDDLFILDVREPNEYQINRIPGSTLIPLGELPRRYQELPKDREIVALCKMGGRSAKAQDFLKSVGVSRVKNLKGGILEWVDKVDPSQPKY